MPFLTRLCDTLFPFTTKTTDDTAISPFCLFSLMVQGFASHLTWVGITMPSFSTSNSSRFFCRSSMPFPMYRTRWTASIYNLSQDIISSTSTTPLWTILAAVMMMSRYWRATSVVTFGCVIAVISPRAVHLAFMILMWAGAFWWKSTLLIAHPISWSIFLESGTLSSLLNVRRFSTMFDPAVGAGPRPTGAL